MASTGFSDDDLVYIDPEKREILGLVEIGKDGSPLSKQYQASGDERRGMRRKLYPWGTYRGMKRAFRLEGKLRTESAKNIGGEGDTVQGLNEVIPLLLKDTL